MQLRPYQKDAVKAVYNYFKTKSGNPIVAMPTGTGKSLIIAALIRLALSYKDQRVLILTHVKELIRQNHATALRFCSDSLDAGIYSAGLSSYDTKQDNIFAGIASVHKKADELGHFDLILIDECHLVPDKSTTMYQRFLTEAKKINKKVKVIGFSATPYRMKSGLLTDGVLFTDICYDITSRNAYNELVKKDYLSPLIAKIPDEELDVKGVGIRGGEFIPKELQHAVDKDHITRAALKELINKGQDRKHWLIFASGIEHTKNITDILNENNIEADCLHSKLNDKERDKRLQSFTTGKIQAIVNNNILTTGFDFPGIDLIGMLRPTMSPGLWVQMLGRGTRTAPDKTDCLVLDFAGNTKRLGQINNVVLPQIRRGRGSAIRRPPIKICEKCKTVNYLAARACVGCGFEFPKNIKLTQRAAELDVVAKSKSAIHKVGIDSITYSKHKKAGGVPSMRVSYRSGLNVYREWICFEHSGYPKRKAIQWWSSRTWKPVPKTIDDALLEVADLKKPVFLKINLDGKYPKILDYLFK